MWPTAPFALDEIDTVEAEQFAGWPAAISMHDMAQVFSARLLAAGRIEDARLVRNALSDRAPGAGSHVRLAAE